MTKREIAATLSTINGLISNARLRIRYNEFDQAIASLEAANATTLLAKNRVEEYLSRESVRMGGRNE